MLTKKYVDITRKKLCVSQKSKSRKLKRKYKTVSYSRKISFGNKTFNQRVELMVQPRYNLQGSLKIFDGKKNISNIRFCEDYNEHGTKHIYLYCLREKHPFLGGLFFVHSMLEIIQLAKKRGIHKVLAGVAEENATARSLYKKVGFKEKGIGRDGLIIIEMRI